MLARKFPFHLLAKLAACFIASLPFASCATKSEPQLLANEEKRESALPWNKQEKWETTSQLGPMAEALNQR
ncbi:MAG: hypothetical protein H0T11_06810 [Chthoniobacterales bacterium]|nr:hypothetical protein [Chthoniobacterales bacterium]